MSTTASISSKGTNGTGITEDLAKLLHDSLGKTIVAVVEIRSESRGENLKGDETVKLAIQTLEPAPNDMTIDHLRELARSFHYERQLASGQPTLDGDDIEPKVSDVLAHGQQFKPHPYLASTLSTDDNAICDVCGQHEAAPAHAERKGLDDPFALPDDAVDVTGTLDEPHAFVESTIDGICAECEEPVADDIHNVDDPAVEECPHPGCELVAEHDGDHDPDE